MTQEWIKWFLGQIFKMKTPIHIPIIGPIHQCDDFLTCLLLPGCGTPRSRTLSTPEWHTFWTKRKISHCNFSTRRGLESFIFPVHFLKFKVISGDVKWYQIEGLERERCTFWPKELIFTVPSLRGVVFYNAWNKGKMSNSCQLTERKINAFGTIALVDFHSSFRRGICHFETFTFAWCTGISWVCDLSRCTARQRKWQKNTIIGLHC